MFCTKCGAQLEERAVFCQNCGGQVKVENTQSETEVVFELPVEDKGETPVYESNDIARQLVKVKTEYYMPKFADMKQNTKYASWNWSAFLVPAYWLLYRKMYVETAIMLVASHILAFFGGIVFAVNAIIGIFGNWLYMKHIDRRAEEAVKYIGDERTRFIDKKGGVSKIAVAILVAINVVVFSLIFMFAVAFMMYV